ncbi:NAD(P)H-hydrate dehydratase [Capnocytophaga sp. oral taxon 878]|uniref:NAD(P)H-hydrate dehydratase n=1 Tax=Capnocytophaga sp. oral taxon 878 TaxID=1316596 RepID=UPI000D039D39|nr:NAD(P)H-hydrate dehydratase [Capnocytophaga sp. oral taxon 878]AVM51123.1 bifunctional ADP-dependent NAD(P)H-hydrate dehydratase/NAD(P)H-hydrate epimerase [Capnocytophaga sp. oral taxon 878]
MKILTTEQLKEADMRTMSAQLITSWQLMERAAGKLFTWLKNYLDKKKTITVLAGAGNNGGDGLALARMLSQAGWQVHTFILYFSEELSGDCQKNKDLLTKNKIRTKPINCHNLSSIVYGDVIIDAIFGIGFNRSAPKWVQSIFNEINAAKAEGKEVISIDMPSGLPTDRMPNANEVFVCADKVLTFQSPKLPFLLPSTGQYIGDWEVLDIGLNKPFIDQLSTEFEYLTEAEIDALIKPRGKFTHKGTYGHALLVGGSYGKMGAVVLAGKAALRTGVGLLTVAIPRCGYGVLQTALPEAMVLTCDSEKHYESTQIPFQPSAIGVGIGWGKEEETAKALGALFKTYKQTPFVIDADALNLIAENPKLLKQLPYEAVLTPHPKELERLIGVWKDDYDKLAKAKAFAQKHNIVLVIKGAYTMITDGARYWVNSTGNAGMATAGSGDVLTGWITSLLAQGYPALQAACIGVYQHGAKGDEVASNIGENSLIASDLCNPSVMKKR